MGHVKNFWLTYDKLILRNPYLINTKTGSSSTWEFPQSQPWMETHSGGWGCSKISSSHCLEPIQPKPAKKLASFRTEILGQTSSILSFYPHFFSRLYIGDQVRGVAMDFVIHDDQVPLESPWIVWGFFWLPCLITGNYTHRSSSNCGTSGTQGHSLQTQFYDPVCPVAGGVKCD